jgi:hypothetical protein
MPLPRQQQNTQPVGVSAPIAGILATGIYLGAGMNASQGDMGTDSAIWLYNMIAGEYGCRVRPGSRDFATNIPDVADVDGDIRTVMYYNSIVSGGVQDHVFACTDLGIFDITAGGAGPWVLGDRPADFTWPNQGANAGWTTFVNYTNVAGDHFLLAADEDNGYYIFDGATWAAGTFTGSPAPDAADLVHIVEWNGRIWFVEKNSARAWFLDPLALEGGITPMDVGSRFKDGGHLVQNSTWTLDAGDGMDDKLVQISASGDVLIWQGIDPTTAADLTLVGRWQVGSVPEGRKVMSDWGGDVMILSTSGLITASALLGGAASLDKSQYASENINQYVRLEMERTLDEFGWSLQLVPHQGIALITVPQPSGSTRAPIQFCLETTKNAWSMFRDLKMLCQIKYGSQFLFGTYDGRVMLLEGTVDDVILDGSQGVGITFSLLTHYSALGNAANWKRPQFIRPYWIGASQPVFAVQIRYDFDLAELLSSPAYTEQGIALWDTAIWDADVWQGTAQSYLETIGLSGMGRHVAIAIRGTAVNDLTYVGADIMLDAGGLL